MNARYAILFGLAAILLALWLGSNGLDRGLEMQRQYNQRTTQVITSLNTPTGTVYEDGSVCDPMDVCAGVVRAGSVGR